jgi:hypothetical protein
MQSVIYETYRSGSNFAVVPARIQGELGGAEIEPCSLSEGDAALHKIALTLSGIKYDLHASEYSAGCVFLKEKWCTARAEIEQYFRLTS